MPNHPHRVLLLEDNSNDVYLTQVLLRNIADVVSVDNRQDYEVLLTSIHAMLFDLILADVQVPGFDGWDALKLAKHHRPSVPFVYLSGSVEDSKLAEVMKLGAYDYVQKDRVARLEMVVKRIFNLPL